jgi:hypothetical protein
LGEGSRAAAPAQGPAQGARPQPIAPVIDMPGSIQRWLARGLFLGAAFCLMGLGGGTESGSGSNIPLPQENFTATVADRSGQSLEARRFNWEGKVQFRAQLGNATVSLPFSKIKSVKIAGGEGDKGNVALIKAAVTLRSGDTVEVLLDRGSKCYGETKFGNYEIFLKDVASIEFQP